MGRPAARAAVQQAVHKGRVLNSRQVEKYLGRYGSESGVSVYHAIDDLLIIGEFVSDGEFRVITVVRGNIRDEARKLFGA